MRKVFLDCGAHKATSIKKFREEYPNSKDYEIISFECNPKFKSILENTNGITFYNKAVWVKDGIEKFYIGHGASSSLIHGKTRGNLDFDNPIEVDCIDLSKWITENFDKDDYIILKLDVEGAEYSILQNLLDTNYISYINEIYLEWHIGPKTDYENTYSFISNFTTVCSELNIKIDANWDAQQKQYSPSL